MNVVPVWFDGRVHYFPCEEGETVASKNKRYLEWKEKERERDKDERERDHRIIEHRD